MAHPLPRWFRALFVSVLLSLCVVMAFQLFHQASLRQQADQLTQELDITRQRLAKQQLEYEQALAKLPAVEAELTDTAPKAAAVYAREQELRAQRKLLKAEGAQLEETLSNLQPELDAAAAAVLNAQLAAEYLEEALEDLRAIFP